MWQLAADPQFTQLASQENRTCFASNVNCLTSHQPNRVYGPPYGSVWYWRVGLTTSAGIVYSQTFMFTATSPPDRDRDGTPGATYNGSHTGGGSVSLTVSADGSGVRRYQTPGCSHTVRPPHSHV